MNEKLKILRSNCGIAGITALFIYFISTIVGSSTVFLVFQFAVATIALIAYSIKLGAEIVSNEKFGTSIFLICICFFDAIWSVLQLI